MIELFLALLIGTVIGIVAGLLPGLHPNNILFLGPIFLIWFDPLSAAIILLSCGVINSFINFIPSILLGAPEDSNALGVLPGHRLLMQGRGYEAIKLCVTGCFGGVLFAVMTLPILSIFIPAIYAFIRPNVQWLLIFVVAYMVISEKGKNKLYALLIFLVSGILGMIVLNNMSDSMLFPLLSGLFGLPMLLLSIFEKSKPPEDFGFDENKIERKNILSCIGIGSLAGIVAGLLPGVGSTQSTILTQQLFHRKSDERSFLISIGAITSSDIVYSVLSIWLIGNPRSGIAVGISKLVEVGLKEVMLFCAFIIISASIATILTLKFTKISLKFLKKINYQKLC
ncbi:MAG: tripartite tricarboxylate transporter permease, partial [Candidatus Aenigmatarchaeota archaeon]